MLDPMLIQETTRSWLYFLSEALSDSDINIKYQMLDIRTESGEVLENISECIVLSPAHEWRISSALPDSIELLFSINIIVSVPAGRTMQAYYRSLELQNLIQVALFSSERYLTGTSQGALRYALPLLAFRDTGEVDSTVDVYGIQYESGHTWKRFPETINNICSWNINIPVTVTR